MKETMIKKIKEIFSEKSLIERQPKFWFLSDTMISLILIIILIGVAVLIGKFYQPSSEDINRLNSEYLDGIRKAYTDCRNDKTETGVRKFTENYCREIMQKSLKELGY